MKTLQESDYKHTAEMLGTDVASIKAVLEVETGNRSGFVAEGKPRIVFDGSIFWKQLKKRRIDPAKLQKGNEDIIYPVMSKIPYKDELNEYDKLHKAMLIHPAAALLSTRWGLALIIGLDYKLCGCLSITEFEEKMYMSEGKQLELFAQIIKNKHCEVYLHNRDWTGFCRHFYKPYSPGITYGKRLAAAYARYKSK